MNSVFTVANYLETNAKSIGGKIVDYGLEKLDFELPKEVIEKAQNYQTEFIRHLSVAITIEEEELLTKSSIEWNKKYGQQHEISLLQNVSSIVQPFAGLRLQLNTLITSISEEHGLTVKESVFINNRLNFMLDVNLTESILYYENYIKDNQTKQHNEIIKLSSPIVPI